MVQFNYEIYRESYSGTSYNYVKGVKTVRYRSQTNSEDNIHFGFISPNYIEVEVFLTDHPMVAVGEIVRLIRNCNFNSAFEEQNSRTTAIEDYFEVYEVSVVSKNSYRFVAYDGLKRLDADYSARLRELNDNNSFPMTIAALLQDAASIAGLTISDGNIDRYPPGSLTINGFYSEGITCRDLFTWYLELVGSITNFGTFSTNAINFTGYSKGGNDRGYQSFSKYIICPTDQHTYYDDNNNELIPVFYKQDGMNDSNITVQAVDQVVIVKSDGTVYGKSPEDAVNPTNIYYVSGNPFIDLIQDTSYGSYVAGRIKNSLASLGAYRVAEIKLFPFRFPFDSRSIVLVEDINGNRWTMPIMSFDVTDEQVVISSYGNETYKAGAGAYNTADQKTTSLDIRVNNIDSDKVSKTGDTMTGELLLDGSDLALQDFYRFRIKGNKKSKAGETPTIQATSNFGGFQIYDKDDNLIFYNQASLSTSQERIYTSYIIRRRLSNNTQVSNGFYIGVNGNGSAYVAFAGDGENAWRNALGLGTSGVLPITIAQGGTNATTEADARANLSLPCMLHVGTVANGTSKTFTFTEVVSMIVQVSSGTAGRNGLYLIYGRTSACVVETILASSTVTFDVSTNAKVVLSAASNVIVNCIITGGAEGVTVT